MAEYMQWIIEAPVGAISTRPAIEAVDDYILGICARISVDCAGKQFCMLVGIYASRKGVANLVGGDLVELMASITEPRAPQALGALATEGMLAGDKRIPHYRAQAAKARGDPLEPIVKLGLVGLILGIRRICTSLIPKIVDDGGHLSWANHT